MVGWNKKPTRRVILGLFPTASVAIMQSLPQSSAQTLQKTAKPPIEPGLKLTDTGTGLDRIVLIEATGLFRLGFSAGDNWGLDQWYDLVNDPQAKTNLLDSSDTSNPTVAEPGMFQQVFYGTVPDDPKLYTRAAYHFFPNSPRAFDIIENRASRVVVEATSSPIVNAVGVLSNLICRVRYEIYPDGQIHITSRTTCKEEQAIRTWFFATLGLGDPTSTGSFRPFDKQGWIRSTALQSPYVYLGTTEPFLYAYWSQDSDVPYRHWAKASILLVPSPENLLRGKQHMHTWSGFKRWYYDVEHVNLAPGQTISQDYLIQLGAKSSTVLPDIDNSAIAGSIAGIYIAARQ